MAEDWEGNTTEQIIANKLVNRVKDGDIILMHDLYETTIKAVEKLFEVKVLKVNTVSVKGKEKRVG